MVQLASDHRLESDWHRLRGERVELFSTRLPFDSLMTPAHLQAMQRSIHEAASLIAPGLPLDVMVYGCTSASLLIGERRVAEELTRCRPGIPATNPLTACRAALVALGAERIAVLTPYISRVNEPLFEYFERHGFTVSAFGAFHLHSDREVACIRRDVIERAVADLASGTKVDALFLSCTNLPVLGMLEQLERDCGVTVVSSNQALFWHALQLVGEPPGVAGFGRLLRPPEKRHPLI